MRCVVALIIIQLTLVGCSPPVPMSDPDASIDNLIEPTRVGDFVIGHSTMAEILGADTANARREFSQQGLEFEFDRGAALTGVMVFSTSYRLPNGISVGDSADKIRSEFGEPTANKLTSEKFSLPALVYTEYTFLLHEDKVSAIRVGGT